MADSPSPRAAIFSSGPNTPGALLFEYLTPTTYASSHPLAFLSEFQLHRRIHGIIGILDSSEYTDQPLSDALSGFHRSLKDLPKTFATKVYGFDPTEKQLDEGRRMKEIEGLVMVPSTGDIAFYLHTVLADFASEVLWEFSNMVRRIDCPSTVVSSLTLYAPAGGSTRVSVGDRHATRDPRPLESLRLHRAQA